MKRKGMISMLSLQDQVVHKVSNLSEDNLQFLLEIIDRFMQADTVQDKEPVVSKRIGIAKGQKLYDDSYDFDEMNPEIAKMFGVVE